MSGSDNKTDSIDSQLVVAQAETVSCSLLGTARVDDRPP